MLQLVMQQERSSIILMLTYFDAKINSQFIFMHMFLLRQLKLGFVSRTDVARLTRLGSFLRVCALVQARLLWEQETRSIFLFCLPVHHAFQCHS